MKPSVLLVLSALVCVSTTAVAQTYSTHVEVEEDPLSDGGKWQNSTNQSNAPSSSIPPIWISVPDAGGWSSLMTPASRVGLREAEALVNVHKRVSPEY